MMYRPPPLGQATMNNLTREMKKYKWKYNVRNRPQCENGEMFLLLRVN